MIDMIMRVSEIRKDALRRMKVAGNEGDTPAMLRLTGIFEELEQVEADLRKLSVVLDKLSKSIAMEDRSTGRSSSRSYEDLAREEPLSGRERGEFRRSELITTLKSKGIDLTPYKGIRYKTKSGKIVGIGYASERRPNRWFVGVPIENYHALVVLCERKRGKVEQFVLPGDFLNTHLDELENQGQIKFNIIYRDDFFQMLIPGGQREDLREFYSNYEGLKE